MKLILAVFVFLGIVAPSLSCTDDSECDGNLKSLTGTCNKTNKRCICAGGFLPKGDECVVFDEPRVVGILEIAKEGVISLACKSDNADITGLTYSWKKDLSIIANAKAAVYIKGRLGVGDAGKYTCTTGFKSLLAKTSAEVDVTIVTELDEPTVNLEIVQKGGIRLTCQSNNAELTRLTYSWEKDGDTIANANAAVYTKCEVGAEDAGNYKCTTDFPGLTAQTSAEVDVKIVAPGPVCTTDSDCDGTEKSLTGKCDATKKRCVCAGDECDGVAQMAASLLLVLAAAVFARLM